MYHFRPARREDTSTILALYRQAVGSPGCSWDEGYPAMANIEEDLSLKALYVLEGEGEVLAAVSCGPFHELDQLPWRALSQAPLELARLCVKRECQGRGLAGKILDALLRELGGRCIRLLVRPDNEAAKHLYLKRGFLPVGETLLYDLDFICCERKEKF
ncbi:MAG: GNAT family N-acetyltransferase [Clostridia bacterium]|nr:GNAT family N-acetyltransferase [Clostridia bacterium]